MPSSTNILNYPFAAQWFTFSKMQVNLVFVWQSYSTSTSTWIMNQGLNIPHVLHRAVTFMFGIQVDGKGRKGLQLVYDPVKIFSIWLGMLRHFWPFQLLSPSFCSKGDDIEIIRQWQLPATDSFGMSISKSNDGRVKITRGRAQFRKPWDTFK